MILNRYVFLISLVDQASTIVSIQRNRNVVLRITSHYNHLAIFCMDVPKLTRSDASIVDSNCRVGFIVVLLVEWRSYNDARTIESAWKHLKS